MDAVLTADERAEELSAVHRETALAGAAAAGIWARARRRAGGGGGGGRVRVVRPAAGTCAGHGGDVLDLAWSQHRVRPARGQTDFPCPPAGG